MRDDNDTNISKKEVSMMNGFSPFLLLINIYTCYGGGMVFPNSWYMIYPHLDHVLLVSNLKHIK